MKITRLADYGWVIWALLLVAGVSTSCAPRPARRGAMIEDRLPFVYVGGYRPEILGFRLDLAAGTLTPAGSTPAGTAPSFLAWEQSAKVLFALDEIGAGQVTAFAIAQSSDRRAGQKTGALTPLNTVFSAGFDPAHLSVDHTGRWLLVANYAGKPPGTVSVLPIGADGHLGAPTDTRDLGPGTKPHMIITDPTNRYVFVPCKGGPYVSQLRFDAATGKLTANSPDRVTWPGARAPRHITFHPDGRFAYVIDERALTMTALAYDRTTGRLTPRQTISTLPPGVVATAGFSAAALLVHPAGKFLYGSNRGHDSIVIYRLDKASGRLTLVGHETRELKQPRHFTIDPTGTLLLVANEGADSITVFRIDQKTGRLALLGQPVPAGTRPTFVGVTMLPK